MFLKHIHVNLDISIYILYEYLTNVVALKYNYHDIDFMEAKPTEGMER